MKIDIIDTSKHIQDSKKYLELDFKHIIEKIVILWDTPEVQVYLKQLLEQGRKNKSSQKDSLVIDDSSRHDIVILNECRKEQGFPFEVFLEISDLLEISKLLKTCIKNDFGIWDTCLIFDKKGFMRDINDNITTKKR